MSETLVTVYCQETEQQERARIKAGKLMPSFQYTVVSTKRAEKV